VSPFLEVEGARIYYESEGEGHPVLLLHGGLGTLRMWDRQVPALAERYRVIRYDQRGLGRTETEDVEFSNRADIAAVLDHVGAPTAHVVGQSRGGMIGLDFVIERPERVDAFVSVASGIGGYEPDLPDGTPVPPWDDMEHLWEAKDWGPLSELETQVWVDGWGQPSTRIDPELRRTVADWILTGYRAEKEDGKPQPLDPPAVHRLGEVRVPLLVMTGLVDEAGGLAAARHLAATVPAARLVEFPGVAHMIQLEEPEGFNKLLLEFLSEVDG
jgi:3-oxoadipate enol-lactonase